MLNVADRVKPAQCPKKVFVFVLTKYVQSNNAIFSTNTRCGVEAVVRQKVKIVVELPNTFP